MWPARVSSKRRPIQSSPETMGDNDRPLRSLSASEFSSAYASGLSPTEVIAATLAHVRYQSVAQRDRWHRTGIWSADTIVRRRKPSPDDCGRPRGNRELGGELPHPNGMWWRTERFKCATMAAVPAEPCADIAYASRHTEGATAVCGRFV